MHRYVCAAALILCLAPAAHGQELQPTTLALNTANSFPTDLLLAPLTLPSLQFPAPVQGPAPAKALRPHALLPLYASFAALQVADMHSTSRALSSGAAVEANPVMSGVVGNRAAFIAAKAGSSAALFWASEKIWRKNRAAAVMFMVVANGAMGAIVAHNYSVR